MLIYPKIWPKSDVSQNSPKLLVCSSGNRLSKNRLFCKFSVYTTIGARLLNNFHPTPKGPIVDYSIEWKTFDDRFQVCMCLSPAFQVRAQTHIYRKENLISWSKRNTINWTSLFEIDKANFTFWTVVSLSCTSARSVTRKTCVWIHF